MTQVLTDLRPAWWIARGWLAWWLVIAMFFGVHPMWPQAVPSVVSLLFVVTCSYLLGWFWRARRPGQLVWASGILFLLNGFAAIMLPIVLSYSAYVATNFNASPEIDGLRNNGTPISAVYAYDEQGRLIPNASFVDQDGVPLSLPPVPQATLPPPEQTASASPTENISPTASPSASSTPSPTSPSSTTTPPETSSTTAN